MSAGVGLRFREVMHGGFASGALDPASGARAGKRDGTVLTLSVTAEIPDADAFVRDPRHEGRLRGTVSFPALGAASIPAEGVFRLFVPGGGAAKLMTYSVVFQAGASPYYLDGVKHVGGRSVLRAWSDTTTLAARLHAGADAAGPVVAAGILRLTPAAFARQLLSFRTPGTSSAGAAARALAVFLVFFSRELAGAYVLRRSGR
jgi:cholesterol oxidase